jgi:hypothetical protein
VKNDDQAFADWVHKLHTEWLPNWQDMPDNTFVWWNLLLTVLDEASTDEFGDVVVRMAAPALSAAHCASTDPQLCLPTLDAAPDVQKPERGACGGSSRGRTGRHRPAGAAVR